MERIPSASTPLMRFPMTSRSRSRRTTSTSGNSGIVPLRWGLRGPRGDRVRPVVRARGLVVAEGAPRDACRGLLRLLLGSTLAGPPGLAAQQHLGVEPLGMVRAFVPDLVARQLLERLRCELLQAGLVVVAAGA